MNSYHCAFYKKYVNRKICKACDYELTCETFEEFNPPGRGALLFIPLFIVAVLAALSVVAFMIY